MEFEQTSGLGTQPGSKKRSWALDSELYNISLEKRWAFRIAHERVFEYLQGFFSKTATGETYRSPNQLLSMVVNKVSEIFGPCAIAIGITDTRCNHLEIKAVRDGTQIKRGAQLSLNNPDVSRSLESPGISLLLADEMLPTTRHFLFGDLSARSPCLFVPIRNGLRAIGLILITSDTYRENGLENLSIAGMIGLLIKLGLCHHVPRFRALNIDGKSLLSMTDNDWRSRLQLYSSRERNILRKYIYSVANVPDLIKLRMDGHALQVCERFLPPIGEMLGSTLEHTEKLYGLQKLRDVTRDLTATQDDVYHLVVSLCSATLPQIQKAHVWKLNNPLGEAYQVASCPMAGKRINPFLQWKPRQMTQLDLLRLCDGTTVTTGSIVSARRGDSFNLESSRFGVRWSDGSTEHMPWKRMRCLLSVSKPKLSEQFRVDLLRTGGPAAFTERCSRLSFILVPLESQTLSDNRQHNDTCLVMVTRTGSSLVIKEAMSFGVELAEVTRLNIRCLSLRHQLKLERAAYLNEIRAYCTEFRCRYEKEQYPSLRELKTFLDLVVQKVGLALPGVWSAFALLQPWALALNYVSSSDCEFHGSMEITRDANPRSISFRAIDERSIQVNNDQQGTFNIGNSFVSIPLLEGDAPVGVLELGTFASLPKCRVDEVQPTPDVLEFCRILSGEIGNVVALGTRSTMMRELHGFTKCEYASRVDALLLASSILSKCILRAEALGIYEITENQPNTFDISTIKELAKGNEERALELESQSGWDPAGDRFRLALLALLERHGETRVETISRAFDCTALVAEQLHQEVKRRVPAANATVVDLYGCAKPSLLNQTMLKNYKVFGDSPRVQADSSGRQLLLRVFDDSDFEFARKRYNEDEKDSKTTCQQCSKHWGYFIVINGQVSENELHFIQNVGAKTHEVISCVAGRNIRARKRMRVYSRVRAAVAGLLAQPYSNIIDGESERAFENLHDVQLLSLHEIYRCLPGTRSMFAEKWDEENTFIVTAEVPPGNLNGTHLRSARSLSSQLSLSKKIVGTMADLCDLLGTTELKMVGAPCGGHHAVTVQMSGFGFLSVMGFTNEHTSETNITLLEEGVVDFLLSLADALAQGMRHLSVRGRQRRTRLRAEASKQLEDFFTVKKCEVVSDKHLVDHTLKFLGVCAVGCDAYVGIADLSCGKMQYFYRLEGRGRLCLRTVDLEPSWLFAELSSVDEVIRCRRQELLPKDLFSVGVLDAPLRKNFSTGRKRDGTLLSVGSTNVHVILCGFAGVSRLDNDDLVSFVKKTTHLLSTALLHNWLNLSFEEIVRTVLADRSAEHVIMDAVVKCVPTVIKHVSMCRGKRNGNCGPCCSHCSYGTDVTSSWQSCASSTPESALLGRPADISADQVKRREADTVANKLIGDEQNFDLDCGWSLTITTTWRSMSHIERDYLDALFQAGSIYIEHVRHRHWQDQLWASMVDQSTASFQSLIASPLSTWPATERALHRTLQEILKSIVALSGAEACFIGLLQHGGENLQVWYKESNEFSCCQATFNEDNDTGVLEDLIPLDRDSDASLFEVIDDDLTFCGPLQDLDSSMYANLSPDLARGTQKRAKDLLFCDVSGLFIIPIHKLGLIILHYPKILHARDRKRRPLAYPDRDRAHLHYSSRRPTVGSSYVVSEPQSDIDSTVVGQDMRYFFENLRILGSWLSRQLSDCKREFCVSSLMAAISKPEASLAGIFSALMEGISINALYLESAAIVESSEKRTPEKGGDQSLELGGGTGVQGEPSDTSVSIRCWYNETSLLNLHSRSSCSTRCDSQAVARWGIHVDHLPLCSKHPLYHWTHSFRVCGWKPSGSEDGMKQESRTSDSLLEIESMRKMRVDRSHRSHQNVFIEHVAPNRGPNTYAIALSEDMLPSYSLCIVARGPMGLLPVEKDSIEHLARLFRRKAKGIFARIVARSVSKQLVYILASILGSSLAFVADVDHTYACKRDTQARVSLTQRAKGTEEQEDALEGGLGPKHNTVQLTYTLHSGNEWDCLSIDELKSKVRSFLSSKTIKKDEHPLIHSFRSRSRRRQLSIQQEQDEKSKKSRVGSPRMKKRSPHYTQRNTLSDGESADIIGQHPFTVCPAIIVPFGGDGFLYHLVCFFQPEDSAYLQLILPLAERFRRIGASTVGRLIAKDLRPETAEIALLHVLHCNAKERLISNATSLAREIRRHQESANTVGTQRVYLIAARLLGCDATEKRWKSVQKVFADADVVSNLASVDPFARERWPNFLSCRALINSLSITELRRRLSVPALALLELIQISMSIVYILRKKDWEGKLDISLKVVSILTRLQRNFRRRRALRLSLHT